MSKFISLVLCGIFLGSVVYGSSLRVESMGGVTVCVRDDENDSIAINPARVSLVETSKLLGNIAPWNRISKSDSKKEYLETPPTWEKNEYTESESSDLTLDFNALSYFKPTAHIGFGAQLDFSNQSNKNFSKSKYVGKWMGWEPVYISTATHEVKFEGATELSPLSLNLLGGYNLGMVAFGAKVNLKPGYKETSESKITTIDQEYYTPFSTTVVNSTKYETKTNNIEI